MARPINYDTQKVSEIDEDTYVLLASPTLGDRKIKVSNLDKEESANE